MRHIMTFCVGLVLIGQLCLQPARAHHSRAPYHIDRTIEVVGEVSRVAWKNPHVYFDVEGSAPGGEPETWVLEGHSVTGMTRNGWQKDSVQVGDQVVAVINPAKNAEKRIGLIDHFGYADGRSFYAFRPPPPDASADRVAQATAERPPQRDIDMEPSTDFSGNWSYTRSLRNLLISPAPDFSRFSLTDKGLAQARSFDQADNPTFHCQDPGVPFLFTYAYEHRWIREKDRIVIEKEQAGRDMIRTIYLDGRSAPPDFVPSPVGFSTGRFEDDGRVLVIETSHFSATDWGLTKGIDSSTRKRLTERYHLLNGGMRMLLEYEVDDPEYLTEPIRMLGVYDIRPDREFVWVDCDPEAAARHLALEQP
jgi:hypothetical protein